MRPCVKVCSIFFKKYIPHISNEKNETVLLVVLIFDSTYKKKLIGILFENYFSLDRSNICSMLIIAEPNLSEI